MRMIDDYPDPEAYREWVRRRIHSEALKLLAFGAIDAFESVTDGDQELSESLATLHAAATHPRFVVWEVGLPLLARLAESSIEARKRIRQMAEDRLAENRRRSAQYLTDRYPRSFCLALLQQFLTDRSAKVRGFAAGRICDLALTELIPHIEWARDRERNAVALFELSIALGLLRDNYFEYENSNGYNLVLNYPELYPAQTLWPGQISRVDVERNGIEAVRQRFVTYAVRVGRRPWLWDNDAKDRPDEPL